MGLSHQEFFRTLPAALKNRQYQQQGNTVLVEDDNRRLTIQLGEQRSRRIALLELPVTTVTVEFDNYSEAEIAAFKRHFDRTFQRGGG